MMTQPTKEEVNLQPGRQHPTRYGYLGVGSDLYSWSCRSFDSAVKSREAEVTRSHGQQESPRAQIGLGAY